MNRNYTNHTLGLMPDQILIKQIVFHEAGHAAAIYLYNKQKHLPLVDFQITIKKSNCSQATPFASRTVKLDHFVAMVEGGCLIQNLPITLIESANYFSMDEQDTYRLAYEADMINLLVGPLAEAKHVALRDNECFSNKLINVDALHNYGDTGDIEKVYDYLKNFISDTRLHEAIIIELFNQAFQFIDSPVHWQAIERLAGYILDNSKNTITCEEAIAVLDKNTGYQGGTLSRRMICQVPKSPSFRPGERSEGWPESNCHGWQLQSIQLIYRHFDLSGYAVANLRD